MNSEDLFRCIGDIDDELILRSERRRRIPYKKIVAVAACIAVLASAGTAVKLLIWDHENQDPALDSLNQNSVLTESQSSSANDHSVFIPAIELPDSKENVQMDMLALVVYKGRIYTGCKCYTKDESEKISSLVGEYLGYATGGIDEWSTQDDYSKELASNITGDIYSVNGYDTDFRICMRSTVRDENGNTSDTIEFFENLNGITLSTGKDLFEDRLKISKKLNGVKYQKHEDWDEDRKIYNELSDVTEEQLKEFLSQLAGGEFEYVWEQNPDFYNCEKQAHLYLTLDDNTTAELRLFEGGYVGYQDLGWHFVKMPGEAFDKVFEACR